MKEKQSDLNEQVIVVDIGGKIYRFKNKKAYEKFLKEMQNLNIRF